jgi:hypothetical protein
MSGRLKSILATPEGTWTLFSCGVLLEATSRRVYTEGSHMLYVVWGSAGLKSQPQHKTCLPTNAPSYLSFARSFQLSCMNIPKPDRAFASHMPNITALFRHLAANCSAARAELQHQNPPKELIPDRRAKGIHHGSHSQIYISAECTWNLASTAWDASSWISSSPFDGQHSSPQTLN